MILQGSFSESILMNNEIRPYPVSPRETAGITDMSKAHFRYALQESDYPNLIIDEPIYDGLGDVIQPGYYQLALSDEKNFLILIQSQKAVAIIPVFKLEDDGGADAREKLNQQKNKRYLKRQKKEIQKTHEARSKKGMPPISDNIHMEAKIEYINDGQYYLIMYERENTRAWGAIKG